MYAATFAPVNQAPPRVDRLRRGCCDLAALGTSSADEPGADAPDPEIGEPVNRAAPPLAARIDALLADGLEDDAEAEADGDVAVAVDIDVDAAEVAVPVIDAADDPDLVEELDADDAELDAEVVVAPVSKVLPPVAPPRPPVPAGRPALPPLPVRPAVAATALPRPGRPRTIPPPRKPGARPTTPPAPPATRISTTRAVPDLASLPDPDNAADDLADNLNVGDSTMVLDDAAVEASRIQVADSVDDNRLEPGSAIEPDGAPTDGEFGLVLDAPTALDRALGEMNEQGFERRADELDAAVEAAHDQVEQARLAYQLGEWCERKLADEARAIKAYGRALTADPENRANLWAIRRVFQRRQLWPNLARLIDAELRVARDDDERAELLLEKARLLGAQLDDVDGARDALDEARAVAPRHPGVLLEVERGLLQAAGAAPDDHDVQRELVDIWSAQLDVVRQPRRRCALWLDIARVRGLLGDLPGALEATTEAASTGVDGPRVARERVRIAERLGDADLLLAALDDEAGVLLGRFGHAAEPTPGDVDGTPARAQRLRRELVAVRRRQAQVARGAGLGEQAWDYLQHALTLLPDEPLLVADAVELAESLGLQAEVARALAGRAEAEQDPVRRLVLQLRQAGAHARGGDDDALRAVVARIEGSWPGLAPVVAARDLLASGSGDLLAQATAWAEGAAALRLGTALGPRVETVPTSADRGAAAAWFTVAGALALAAARGHLDRGEPPDGRAADALGLARGAIDRALEAVPELTPALELKVDVLALQGDDDAAAAELARQVDRAAPDDLAPTLERQVAFRRQRGDLEGALAGLERLQGLAPDDVDLAWRHEALLAQLGRDDQRAVALEAIASREPNLDRRLHALSMAARLAERAGALDRALTHYQQILAVDADDDFARESVLDLLRASGRVAELAELRIAQAAQLPDGPAVRQALSEAAWLLELRLDRPGPAARAWQALLDREPEDRVALEGLLRCRRAQGDVPGQIEALSRLTQVASDAHALPSRLAAGVALAWAHEARGQLDEAADVLAQLAAGDARGVAGQIAIWTLIERAIAGGDSAALAERLGELAETSTARPLRRALIEDLAWMRALVLEDDEGAAASFAQANAIEPAVGARLGALLVAARRRDLDGQRIALVQLADEVDAPEARVALRLRAAELARIAGDVDDAALQLAAARELAPDDVGALVLAVETAEAPSLELLGEAAYADAMVQRAELLGMRADLAADVRGRASWELDRALALEHAGRLAEAGRVVAGVLRGAPDDLRALEALRRMSYVGGDLRTAARAAFHLGKRLGDPTSRVARLREAAAIFDPMAAQSPAAQQARDPGAAIAAYRRILAIERGGPEFDALLALLRADGDAEGMVQAITEQLGWMAASSDTRLDVDPDAPLTLLLERATVRHGRGDQPGAAADLDAVLSHDPERADALRFRGDLAATQGEIDLAIEMWRRYLDVEARPARRAEVEQALARVLAESSLPPAAAVAELAKVIQRSREDLGLHERMLGLATRAADHKQVVRTLGEMARLRDSELDKARDEHRAAVVYRDKLADPTGARAALERARRHDPGNLDIVRDLIALLDKPAAQRVLTTVIADQREAIALAPGQPAPIERLAVLAALAGDADLRWLSLAVLDGVGTLHAEQRAALVAGRANLPALPGTRLTAAQRPKVVNAPGAVTALAELWALMASAVTTVLGVDPVRLGFARGDRGALRKLPEKYVAVSRALALVAIDDAEVWISDKRTGVTRCFAGDTPVVCLGADVALAATPEARFALGRCAQLAASAAGALPELRDIELAWLVAAAIRASDGKVPEGLAGAVTADDTAVAERTRALGKALGRKEKRAIATWSTSQRVDAPMLAGWRRATIGVANRMGLLAAVDPGAALAQLDVGHGGQAIEDSPVGQDLVRWTLSAEHVALRAELGLARGKAGNP